ncbi:MAG: general secretion pathway protein GspK [Myxococcaceae bacterium]|nr:general secretion pathway protein GspK [Myxococcaceae bacterium]MBH2006482.1 general secretion pathway protein GspK [Myxococcaceae bacterium]
MVGQAHLPGKRQLRVRGMALLLVVTSLALISAVVTDLMVEQQSEYQIALRQRDALKAQALAEGGLNISGLFLTIQSAIQPYFTQFAAMGVPIPKQTIWEMLSIDSSLFGNLVSGELQTTLGIDVSEAVKKRKAEKQKIQEDHGVFIPPEGGFGSFEGAFSVSVEDEESKISLANWTKAENRSKVRKLVASLFSNRHQDLLFKKVNRADLIANIYDYIDEDELRINPYATPSDWGQPFGGSERDQYASMKDLRPKNAYFDSLSELNLVPGFSDRHFEAFSPALTIYGDDNKVNILSAQEPVVQALIRYCASNDQDPNLQTQTWVDSAAQQWMQYKSTGGGPVSPVGFMKFLKALPLSINDKMCQEILGVESKYFTLKSQATINGVSRTLTLTTRVYKGDQKRYYFRAQ